MSIFLIIVSALLLVGILITLALAWFKPKYAGPAATFTTLVVLLTWLLTGRSLPLSLSLSHSELTVDEMAWQFSLYVILLVLAALAVLMSRLEMTVNADEETASLRTLPSLVLLALLGALLIIWASTFAGLLTGMAFLAVVWLLLIQANSSGPKTLDRSLGRLLALSMGWLLIWLAVALAGDSSQSGLGMVAWPDSAKMLLLLAVIAQLGTFPLHWWRPSDLSLSPDVAALVHIMPTATGAYILARMAASGGFETSHNIILTAAGLLGLLFGVGRAWTNIGKPAQVTKAVALSQPGLILIIGAWAGAEAVVLESRVIILALGILFLANMWPRLRPGWHIVIALAAMAGLPLTAAFGSLAELYNTWLQDGNLILLFVTSLLSALLIGAASLATWHGRHDSGQLTLSQRATLLYGFGLLSLAVSLLALPPGNIGEISPVSWLIIFATAAGGFGLNLYTRNARELRAIFRLEVPYDRFFVWCAKLLTPVGSALRAATDVVEGGAGMLWLLVLVVVFLLAQSGL